MTINDYFEKGFIQNDPDSLYFQGLCYSFGYFVEKDLEKAQLFYKKGIDLGNPKCMYGLATLKLKDKKTSENEIIQLFCNAFDLLYKEAKSNDAISQRMLSCYYLFGNRGIEKDIDKAKYWLIQAANNEDIEALLNLATSYEKGHIFEKNIQNALMYYRKAAELGSTKARKKLQALESN